MSGRAKSRRIHDAIIERKNRNEKPRRAETFIISLVKQWHAEHAAAPAICARHEPIMLPTANMAAA